MATARLVELRDAVVGLARAAGETLRSYRRRSRAELDIAFKGSRDLVTAADLASEEGILTGLRALEPGVPVLSEERPDDAAGEGTRGDIWIVDPLDGTTNFAHGHPLYSVSIARVRDGVPLLGVIHAPELGGGRTWAALAGGGATVDDITMEVSSETDIARALLSTGFSYGRIEMRTGGFEAFGRLLGRAREIRRGGSACLDLAFTAEGIFTGFWEADLKPHDVAAGALLVREAGGVITDFRGGDDWLTGRSIIAGNAGIHAALLEETRTIRWPPGKDA